MTKDSCAEDCSVKCSEATNPKATTTPWNPKVNNSRALARHHYTCAKRPPSAHGANHSRSWESGDSCDPNTEKIERQAAGPPRQKNKLIFTADGDAGCTTVGPVIRRSRAGRTAQFHRPSRSPTVTACQGTTPVNMSHPQGGWTGESRAHALGGAFMVRRELVPEANPGT